MTQSSTSLPCFLLHISNLIHTNRYRISQIPLLANHMGYQGCCLPLWSIDDWGIVQRSDFSQTIWGIRALVYRYDPLMTEVLSNDRTRCQAPCRCLPVIILVPLHSRVEWRDRSAIRMSEVSQASFLHVKGHSSRYIYLHNILTLSLMLDYDLKWPYLDFKGGRATALESNALHQPTIPCVDCIPCATNS